MTKSRLQKINTQIVEQSNVSPLSSDLEMEILPRDFYKDISQIIVDYLDEDILPIQHKEQKKISFAHLYSQCTLSEKPLRDMLKLSANYVSSLILDGGYESIEKALYLVKKKPILVCCQTSVIDSQGRSIEGTPLQVAARTGDFNLKKITTNYEDRGLVERLALIAGLSNEEVREQMETITSIEAKSVNNSRNLRFLNAIKEFSEAIPEIELSNDMSIEAAYLCCKSIIEQFEKKLQIITKEPITVGYIFDLAILYEATKWFENNIKRLRGALSIQSDIFFINGIGKLQTRLSARDKIIISSAYNLFANDYFPHRLSNYVEGASYDKFLNLRLGENFYHTAFGGPAWGRAAGKCITTKGQYIRNFFQVAHYEQIFLRKNNSIEQLTKSPGKTWCQLFTKQILPLTVATVATTYLLGGKLS